MKKVIYILVVVSIIIALTSCRKEYICTCVIPVEGGGAYENDFVARAHRKEKAREKCDLQEHLSTTPNTICTLK